MTPVGGGSRTSWAQFGPGTGRIRFGLRARFTLLLVAAIPAAAALPAWISYRQMQTTERRALSERATAVARAAASNASYCIWGGETECRDLVRVILRIRDVAWVEVIDAQGVMPEGAGAWSPGLGQAGFERIRSRGKIPGKLHLREPGYAGTPYLAVTVPIVQAASSAGGLDAVLGGGHPTEPGTVGAIEVGFGLASRDAAVRRAMWRTLGVVALVVLFALGLGLWVMQLLTTPLYRIARFAEHVVQGDLRGRLEVRSRDEIGLVSVAFNGILSAMRTALERLQEGSERIERAAAELVELMSAQRAGVGENLATVSATTAAISGVVASGGEMRQRGRAAVDLAQKAIGSSEQIASTSHRALEDALGELERIRTHVSDLGARIEELESRADPLGRVIEGVNDMADRLHDLAISAAQEAVVVERGGSASPAAAAPLVGEIRAHAREAHRAGTAARRVLGDLQHAIRRARSAAEDGARAVESSSARTRAVETNLHERGTAVRDVSRALRQLSDLIQEQLGRIEQIFEGVENVRRATSHFTEAADMTLGTARGLSRLSADMKELLAAFRLR